jgi:hypothetical protein
MHFLHHKKTPSSKIGTIHQFAYGVNQFYSFWHVDLSQRSHGTKKFDFK